jgi:hypothetical protein
MELDDGPDSPPDLDQRSRAGFYKFSVFARFLS